MFATFITDIGDSAVMTGVALAGSLYLYFCGCRTSATALMASLLLSAFMIGLFKLLFLGCGWLLPHHYDIRSPSGHAALSVSVMGTCALLISGRLQNIWRFLPPLVAALLVIAIAVTRVTLDAHTVAEVVAGLASGAFALLPVYIFLRRCPLQGYDVNVFVLVIISAALLLHGTHFPAEDFIHAVAYYLGHSISVCARPAA